MLANVFEHESSAEMGNPFGVADHLGKKLVYAGQHTIRLKVKF